MSKNNFKYCLEGTPESITTVRTDGCDENRDEPRLAPRGGGQGQGWVPGAAGKRYTCVFCCVCQEALKEEEKDLGTQEIP